MKLFNRQQGDTILEVLIAVSVLSLILVISLAATNRNTMGNRVAQERGEASEQTESQIEIFKAYLSSTSNPVMPVDGSKFCMKLDGTGFIPVTGTTFAEFEASPDMKANCKKNNLYYIYVERSGNTYTTVTRWDKLSGAGQDEARMVHRLYPDVAASNNGAPATQNCPVDYYIEADGNCKKCAIGYTSPGGYTFVCAPIPAIIAVEVQSIPPTTSPGPNSGTNEWQPPCSNAGVATSGKVDVKLNGQGGPFTGKATLTTIVTHGKSYNANMTLPNNWELCNVTPTGGNIDAVPLGTPSPDNFKKVVFKIRPNCGPQTFQTDPYEHFGDPYRHYSGYYHHLSGTAWYHHHGGEDGRRWWLARQDHYFNENRTVYAGSDSYTGYWTVWYKYRGDIPGTDPYFEVWVNRPDYYGYYRDDYGVYADSLGTYRDDYTLNRCATL